MEQMNTDNFINSHLYLDKSASCERVLDALLLLIIFNTEVIIIVLAQSEFTQVSIVI